MDQVLPDLVSRGHHHGGLVQRLVHEVSVQFDSRAALASLDLDRPLHVVDQAGPQHVRRSLGVGYRNRRLFHPSLAAVLHSNVLELQLGPNRHDLAPKLAEGRVLGLVAHMWALWALQGEVLGRVLGVVHGEAVVLRISVTSGDHDVGAHQADLCPCVEQARSRGAPYAIVVEPQGSLEG